ncbi:hypothetical protein AGMMS49992_21230 [Clostridia bacterium]|nr:hypothetical protein AGMMS49992_21230 [Clostridia bacterium]
MSQEIIDKAAEIIAQHSVMGREYNDNLYCAITLMDTDGYPTSSVITPVMADGIKWITFGTGLGSSKVKRIHATGSVANVSFSGGDFSISLSGDVEIITDPAVKKEMWYSGLENHFTAADDPGYCVLKFTTKRYNLFVDWQYVEGVI